MDGEEEIDLDTFVCFALTTSALAINTKQAMKRKGRIVPPKELTNQNIFASTRSLVFMSPHGLIL
jgi:hypothetical protein